MISIVFNNSLKVSQIFKNIFEILKLVQFQKNILNIIPDTKKVLKIRAEEKLKELKNTLINTVVFPEYFLEQYTCWTEQNLFTVEEIAKIHSLHTESFESRKVVMSTEEFSKYINFDPYELKDIDQFKLFFELDNRRQKFEFLYLLFADSSNESDTIFLSGLLHNSLKEYLDVIQKC